MATYSKPVRRKRAMPQIGRRQNRLDQPNCRQWCRKAGFALHSIRRVQAVKRSQGAAADREMDPTSDAIPKAFGKRLAPAPPGQPQSYCDGCVGNFALPREIGAQDCPSREDVPRANPRLTLPIRVALAPAF